MSGSAKLALEFKRLTLSFDLPAHIFRSHLMLKVRSSLTDRTGTPSRLAEIRNPAYRGGMGTPSRLAESRNPAYRGGMGIPVRLMALRVCAIAIVTFTSGLTLSGMEGAVASPAYSASSGLPNVKVTPGMASPLVTQANIASTICVVGYTKTIRPPVSYTTPLKYKQLDSGYNLYGDRAARDYEEDHLIPLEVGGDPTDVKNLWPEPRLIVWGTSKKDELENKLHLLVCAHQISLKAAQQVFTTNWIAGYKKFVSGL